MFKAKICSTIPSFNKVFLLTFTSIFSGENVLSGYGSWTQVRQKHLIMQLLPIPKMWRILCIDYFCNLFCNDALYEIVHYNKFCTGELSENIMKHFFFYITFKSDILSFQQLDIPQFKHLLLWMGKQLVSLLGGKCSSGWWEVNSMFWYCISSFVKIIFTFKLRRPDGNSMSGILNTAPIKIQCVDIIRMQIKNGVSQPACAPLGERWRTSIIRTFDLVIKLDLFPLVEWQPTWFIEDQNTGRRSI